MFKGDKINETCDWSVLHTSLRAPCDIDVTSGDQNVTKDVHEVLGQIKPFVDRVRNGELIGLSKKKLKNFLIIGIGGSYLGIEFVYEAMRWHKEAIALSGDRQ